MDGWMDAGGVEPQCDPHQVVDLMMPAAGDE